jgi:hypothetical protein
MSPRQKRRTEIGESFVTYKRSMVESPAFRVRSYAAMRVMHRIEIEHMNHGGAENGRLQVTFDQFVKWGVCRRLIASAIRELAVLGFLEVTEQGHAGAAGNGKATRFRLTYVNCKTGEQPTDEWRRVDTFEIAKAIVAAAKRDASPRARDLGKRSWRARMMEKNLSSRKETGSVHEREPSEPNLSSRRGTTRLSSRRGTTFYNLGVAPSQPQTAPAHPEQQARPPWCKPIVIDLGPITPEQYATLNWEPPAGRPVNELAFSAIQAPH